MSIVLYLAINSIAVFTASSILPGIKVDSFVTALIVAVLLGVVNSFIKPLLIVLTLPLTILTLGLFTFVINGLLVLLIEKIVPGFYVSSILWAILFSILVSIVSSFLTKLAK